MMVTRAMAIIGIEVRGSTWDQCQQGLIARSGNRMFSRTLLMNRWNGSPRSRAKDHIMRDAVARNPMTEAQPRATTIEAITVAPALDLTPL